ncbi:hypothetical protein ACQP1K_02180 [Sphaerimonospora sp. CA-214678]|uniref:hypothetical protein n=1 Tax=Sphaerimonospora sp. CA-214678 TaxID=3240029 RepID=UPI003D8F3A39
MTEPDPRPGGDLRAVAEQLSRLWVTTSERAFAAALHQPDVYVRTTRLVSAIVRELRRRGRGLTPLLEAWHGRHELVRGVAASDGALTVDGLNVETIAGTAFAMRYREVLEEITLDDRLAALAAGPRDGGWLVLEESGHAPGDPFVPYRRLEVDPRTGRALLITTRPDDTFTTCVHVVESGIVDLETGRLAADTAGEPGNAAHEVGTAEEREALAERLKRSSTVEATADANS